MKYCNLFYRGKIWRFIISVLLFCIPYSQVHICYQKLTTYPETGGIHEASCELVKDVRNRLQCHIIGLEQVDRSTRQAIPVIRYGFHWLPAVKQLPLVWEPTVSWSDAIIRLSGHPRDVADSSGNDIRSNDFDVTPTCSISYSLMLQNNLITVVGNYCNYRFI